jgi:hypothetical protein
VAKDSQDMAVEAVAMQSPWASQEQVREVGGVTGLVQRYIANVSIIFMLHACFIPIALCFVYAS